MLLAINTAALNSTDDLPIAAIITDGSDKVLASAANAVTRLGEVSGHAERLAIDSVPLVALRQDAMDMTITVTLEPCPMCAWAIRMSGVGRLIFGAHNPKYGAAGSVFDLARDGRYKRPVEVIGGVREEECQRLLANFFSEMRDN